MIEQKLRALIDEMAATNQSAPFAVTMPLSEEGNPNEELMVVVYRPEGSVTLSEILKLEKAFWQHHSPVEPEEWITQFRAFAAPYGLEVADAFYFWSVE